MSIQQFQKNNKTDQRYGKEQTRGQEKDKIIGLNKMWPSKNNKQRNPCFLSLPLFNPDVWMKWKIGSLIQIVYLTPGIRIFVVKWGKKKKQLSAWPFLKTFYLDLTILNRKNKWNITDWSDIAIKIVMQLSYFGSCTLNTEYRWERREERFKDMEEKWCWFSYFIGCHALRWQSVHTEDINYFFFKQQYILKREETVSESHIA